MTTENENMGTPQQKSQTETGGLDVESLASLLDSSALSSSPQTDATESETNTVEAQNVSLDNPLAEDDQNNFGDDKESTLNKARSHEVDEEEESGIPKHIQKRIDKITAKRREAEEVADRLKAELEELRAKKNEEVPVVRSKNPFSSKLDIAELEKAVQQAREVRDWCEENPYGGEIPRSDGTSVHVDETEVRRMKIQALKDIEKNIPEQVQFINARKHFDPIAEQEYPWWKKKDTKEYNTAVALLKNFPELAQFPDYKLVLGDFVFGMQARQAKKAMPSTSQPRRAPVQPSRPSASPTNAQNNNRANMDAELRFRKTGSKDDLASLIESRLGGR
jgi:hypothetical protein